MRGGGGRSILRCGMSTTTSQQNLLFFHTAATQTFCNVCTNIVAIKALLVHSSTLQAITHEVTMMQYNMCGKDDVYRKGKREFDRDMSMS